MTYVDPAQQPPACPPAATRKPPFPLWPFYATLALIAAPQLFMLAVELPVSSSSVTAMFTIALMLIFSVAIPLTFVIAVDRRRRAASN